MNLVDTNKNNPINAQIELVKAPKLTKPERRKLRVIKKLIDGELNGPKAANQLKLTTRQIRNLKRQVIREGDYGVVHKNHFNKPANTYENDLRLKIAQIYRSEYKGTNFTEFARILQEEKGLPLSRSTIYNILREKRIRSPQRKKNKRKKIAVKG